MRLDQTVHTLSLLHKLRRSRQRVFVVTDDNVAWLLDAVSVLCVQYTYRMLLLMLGSLVNCFDWKLQGGIKVEEMDMDDKFGLTLEKAQPMIAKVDY